MISFRCAAMVLGETHVCRVPPGGGHPAYAGLGLVLLCCVAV
ncbi:MAG: hypothetical protein V9G15_13820 [Dermatophilaceae bacterium]